MKNMHTKITGTQTRFSFGKNWSSFLNLLNEDRIFEAEKSLKDRLGCIALNGKTFLDIGSGSGLFSLAAYRLGAKVFSFDYDEDSVNCTKYLKEKYAQGAGGNWSVEKGSVLDYEFLNKFGKADIVYSWGVLHHTGHMYQALDNAVSLVKEDNGLLFISIYNDQGRASRRWKWIKKKYNNSSSLTRFFICSYGLLRWVPTFARDFLKTGNPLNTWINYGKNNRGMSAWHDLVDWVGGYPFEVAKPEEIFNFFKERGFELQHLKTCSGSIGCNEFVFKRKIKCVE